MEQGAMNGGGQATEVPETIADVTLHVRGVLEAAERAAADTVEQARADAERKTGAAKQRAQELIDERIARIREISDDLLRQAETVEERLAQLDETLGAAMEDLRRELERLPEPPPVDEEESARDAAELEEEVLAR